MRISDDPQRFDPGARLLHEDGRELIVEAARPHRDRFLVRFEGIETRSDAEALRGALYVPSSQKRELEEAEYWADDLGGCRVKLQSGDEVGVARHVLPGTAHDLLVVDTPEGERLVPMVKAIVTSIDLAGKEIIIDPPEGLLE